MARTSWLDRFLKATSAGTRHSSFGDSSTLSRKLHFEALEGRYLLAVDFGDAPDPAIGSGTGNYHTLASDNGPSHVIVAGLKLGPNVDGDSGILQSVLANADDNDSALPDDEDSLTNPAIDLVLSQGTQPQINIRATNLTSSVATLYGWIDYNADGVFDNTSERASAAVPVGTNNGVVSIIFPTVPNGFAGTTYARFRLSTDPAAADSTGAAQDGEVEDYPATILSLVGGTVDNAKSVRISSGQNGGPTLVDNDFFGTSVANIGDLNGDGITDLAVGAEGDDTGSTSTGAVYILFMNSDGTVKSRQKIASNTGGGPALATSDHFGHSVTCLGDLDGDGIAELAVGADLDNTGGTDLGAVYVLFMNNDGTAKGVQKLASGTGGIPTLPSSAQFGESLASMGDIDGDGVPDLAVGVIGDDTAGPDYGAVYLLFMNSNGSVKSIQKITGDSSGSTSDAFGCSVVSLGDLDGDGVTDLAVGAFRDDTGAATNGAVYVIFLNINGTVKARQKIASATGGGPTLSDTAEFGGSLASPGDLNGDGVRDLIVGSEGDGTVGIGAFYVAFMNSNGTMQSSYKVGNGIGGGPSLGQDVFFGSSAASLGDRDGDGRVELVIGADNTDGAGNNRGGVYIFSLIANTNPAITSPASVSIPENTTAVMSATAVDSDVPLQTLSFTIAGGVDAAKFSITSGGALTFKAAPNFELPTDSDHDNVYEVIVRAIDSIGGTATRLVRVTVTPVNEAPAFTTPSALSLPENSTGSLAIVAIDPDLTGQTVTFSMIGGTDQLKFSLTSDGALSFLAPPDYEVPTDSNANNSYVVNIQASDGEGGVATRSFTVSVLPVNDNSPVFTSLHTATVQERTTFAMNVTAIDADLPAQAVTYSIVGGADQSKFTITTSGALSFTSVPNFEFPTDSNTDNVYVVIVQASDGSLTTLDAILVSVTDVSGSAIVFTSPTAASVAENTTAVMNVTVADIGLLTNQVIFSIVGGVDQAKFAITGSGALSFIGSPNFESPTDSNGDNVYIVTVQASDGEGGVNNQTISVSVTPVNDNSPVFTSSDFINLQENSLAVLTVTATDADLPAQSLSFSIAGGVDQSRFSITPGGVMTFLVPPDFEAPADANADNVYVVIVRVSDGSLASVQAILVTVTNSSEGDYTLNGIVDAADYIIWRKTFGTSQPINTGADGSGNGVIDSLDYDIWRAHFGQTSPAVGSGVGLASASMANVTVGESTRQESSLSSTDVLNQIAEPLGTSSAEQVTSHDKIRLAFPLSASSLFSPYRPAVRGSLGAQRLFTVSRRDESLVAWLASQPDTKKQFDQLGTAEIWESDDASEADGVYIDSIELVFAQLESN